MSQSRSLIEYWYAPKPNELGNTVEDFLHRLQGPALLHIPGQDRKRKRAICTLLHGNEPSGTRALLRWLKEDPKPAVDILCFFGSVKTALEPPGFFYRHLPDEQDLNRCFKEPFDSPQGQLAKSFLEFLKAMNPESLIDIHNTSGMGPSFAVAMTDDPEHEAITRLFTQRLLITKLRLGALFEYSERNVPTVTIECGGAQDPRSDDIAYDGIQQYVNLDHVFKTPEDDWPLEVLHEPVRLELVNGGTVSYQDSPDPLADITLQSDVERHNFGRVLPQDHLGWVKTECWDNLTMKTPTGRDIKNEVLTLKGNCLHPVKALKLFMITTNPVIARNDCLFYAVADDHSHLDQEANKH